MTDAYDSFDAPPPDDPPEFRPGSAAPNDYVLKLANAIDRLASVLERSSVAQSFVTSPAAAGPPAPPVAAGPPGGTSNETQIKRGKAIYAKCMNQTPPANVKAIGEHVVGRPLNGNSQKWDEADQVAVLDAMKSWGWA